MRWCHLFDPTYEYDNDMKENYLVGIFLSGDLENIKSLNGANHERLLSAGLIGYRKSIENGYLKLINKILTYLLKKGSHINYGHQNPLYVIGEFQTAKHQERNIYLIKGLIYQTDKWLKLGVYVGQSVFLNTGISILDIDKKPKYTIKDYQRGPENELLTIKGLVYNTLSDILQVGSYYTDYNVL